MASLETFISRAEIAYKSGELKRALCEARGGLRVCGDESTGTALRIFIARVYSKLGKFRESNRLYRRIISERVYLPPIILGMLYNSIELNQNLIKINQNIGLIKLFLSVGHD